MLRRLTFVILSLVFCVFFGRSAEALTTVSFFGVCENVDEPFRTLLRTGHTQNLHLNSLTFLDGFGTVNGYLMNNSGVLYDADLSRRLNRIRGLGIAGGTDGHEIDNHGRRQEVIEIKFKSPVILAELELRSLFRENGHAEHGDIYYFLGDDLMGESDPLGTAHKDGIGKKDVYPNLLLDRIRFQVDRHKRYSGYSDYSVAGLKFNIAEPTPTPVIPEPATASLLGLGLAGLVGFAKRRGG